MLVAMGGMIYADKATTLQYVRETVTETVEVTPEWAEDEDAVRAAQQVIRNKEIDQRLTEIGSSISELEAEKEALEKEIGLY